MPSTQSTQPRFGNTSEALTYLVTLWQNTQADMPAWGVQGRTAKLRNFAREEPILSGALSSMTSKAVSLDWQVIGGRNRAKQYQELLNEAEDGAGWDYCLATWVQDYLNTDIGGVRELAHDGAYGPVTGIYGVDAECIGLTGNVQYPLVYVPKITTTGKLNTKGAIRWTPQDYMRVVDMPSPDESRYGLGFCAVSRAYKAAKVLLALYNYDEEKLSDMPLPGLITVTGMTMGEIEEAFKLYNAKRESKEQVTFKGLLWLAAQSDVLQRIEANLVSFASLPENFDREQTVSLYIYTLALDFGVDAREFWPATQSGATKGEAEVQAQKAKGKGFGQMISAMERAINRKVLPKDVEFGFDRRNDDDDLAREILRGQIVKNIRSMWEPAQGMTEGIITTEEARRLLVDLQAVPEWLDEQPTVTLHSLDKDIPQPEELEPPHPEPTQKPTPPAPAQPPAQPVANAQNKPEMAAKAAKLGLGRGEDLVAVHRGDEVETLWSTRSYFVMPAQPLSLGFANKQRAALAHLQAAGLLITEE